MLKKYLPIFDVAFLLYITKIFFIKILVKSLYDLKIPEIPVPPMYYTYIPGKCRPTHSTEQFFFNLHNCWTMAPDKHQRHLSGSRQHVYLLNGFITTVHISAHAKEISLIPR